MPNLLAGFAVTSFDCGRRNGFAQDAPVFQWAAQIAGFPHLKQHGSLPKGRIVSDSDSIRGAGSAAKAGSEPLSVPRQTWGTLSSPRKNVQGVLEDGRLTLVSPLSPCLALGKRPAQAAWCHILTQPVRQKAQVQSRGS